MLPPSSERFFLCLPIPCPGYFTPREDAGWMDGWAHPASHPVHACLPYLDIDLALNICTFHSIVSLKMEAA